MNWLAHVLLSEPDIEFRLGNLLADLVKGRDRQGMSPRFLLGVRCHQAIDAFTDGHPVVHRSRARIRPEHGRCSGILVDVFYDHFLARDWARYCAEPLAAFTSRLYAEARDCRLALPELAGLALEQIRACDRLGSYQRLDGIATALQRLSIRLTERTGQPFALEEAVVDLTTHFDELAADFAEFFPTLQARVAAWQMTNRVLSA